MAVSTTTSLGKHNGKEARCGPLEVLRHNGARHSAAIPSGPWRLSMGISDEITCETTVVSSACHNWPYIGVPQDRTGQ